LRAAGCGAVVNAQSNGVFQSAQARCGEEILSSSSVPPASSSNTSVEASSDKRAAIAHPAEPAPITM
jgi:hypothetical protein